MVWAYVSGFGSQIDEIVLKFPLAGAIDKVFNYIHYSIKKFHKKSYQLTLLTSYFITATRTGSRGAITVYPVAIK